MDTIGAAGMGAGGSPLLRGFPLHPRGRSISFLTMTRSREAPSERVRVLGIDPGTRVLGYGILDVARGSAPRLVDCGALRLPARPLADRLERVFVEVRSLIQRHRPRVLAIEDVFGGKNIQSVLKVGEARGVVVLAGQMAALEIAEYPPARVKMAATGNGNADKTQVQRMMTRLLHLDGAPGPADVTDALAVAFCHGQRMGIARLADSSRRRRSAKVPARSPSARSTRGASTGRKARSKRPEKERALEELLRGGRTRVFKGSRFRKAAGGTRKR